MRYNLFMNTTEHGGAGEMDDTYFGLGVGPASTWTCRSCGHRGLSSQWSMWGECPTCRSEDTDVELPKAAPAPEWTVRWSTKSECYVARSADGTNVFTIDGTDAAADEHGSALSCSYGPTRVVYRDGTSAMFVDGVTA